MNNNEKIIEIIKNRRTSLKLSLSEVARRMSIPKSTLSRYESLQRQFPLDQISNIAAVLDLSPEYILGISSGETSNSPHTSTYISKTVETMEKLDEPRQKVVLDTAQEQHDEQEAERKANEPIPLHMDDDAIYGHIDRAAAWQGEELTDEDRDAIMIALKKHLEEKAKEESNKGK